MLQEQSQNYHEYYSVDKSKRADSPRAKEPDKVQWIDKATGLDCLIVRNREMGHLCGYVGISSDHFLFNVSYNNIDGLEVHGSLTFSGFCAEDHSDPSIGICHIPAANRPEKVWW